MSASKANQVPPSSPTPPKPSRIRRLWKWTQRLLLVALVLLAITTIGYVIHRGLAFGDGERALAKMRAELNTTEPGWQYENLAAAYEAQIPPAERNSATLVGQLPKPRLRGTIDYQFVEVVLNQRTNEIWSAPNLETANSVAADLPVDHPIIRKLLTIRTGGIPMTDKLDVFDPAWSRLEEIGQSAAPLEIAGASAAARGDHRATIAYIHAMLNSARSIGDIPRVFPQRRRNFLADRAAHMVTRMLAWGEPEEGLAELQRELLSEADRPWLKMALKGERAAINHAVPTFTNEDEINTVIYFVDRNRPPINLKQRAHLFVVRPYRDQCFANTLREISQAIKVCDSPPKERWVAWMELSKREGGQSIVTSVRQRWLQCLASTSRVTYGKDDETRAVLRTTAVAVACERFRREMHRWPTTLAEIPATILPAIPTDPFDGQPLRYRILPGGAIVYSIGRPPSLQDGAIVDFEYKYGTPLWDVSERRKKSQPDRMEEGAPNHAP